MPKIKPIKSLKMDTETYLRFKLITAFNGDVPKAEIALAFVMKKPETSERYRRFELWEKAEYENFCQSHGIRQVSNPTSPKEP